MRNLHPRALKKRVPALPEAPNWPSDPAGPAGLLKRWNLGREEFTTKWVIDAEFDAERNAYICYPEKLDTDDMHALAALRNTADHRRGCFVDITPADGRLRVEIRPRPQAFPPRFAN